MKIIEKKYLTFDDLIFISDNRRGFSEIAKIKLGSIDFLCLKQKHRLSEDEYYYGFVYKTNISNYYSFDPLKKRLSVENVLLKENITKEMINLQKL